MLKQQTFASLLAFHPEISHIHEQFLTAIDALSLLVDLAEQQQIDLTHYHIQTDEVAQAALCLMKLLKDIEPNVS